MPRSLRTVWVFAKVSTLRYSRDPLALFFTIAFPLIFLFVFGGIFGKNGSEVSFKVAVVNQSHSRFATQYAHEAADNTFLKISKDLTTLDAAREKMARGELDAAIVLPPDFGAVRNGTYPSGQLQVYYTQNNYQAAQTLATVLDGSFKKLNAQFVKADVPFTVAMKQVNEKSLSQFDYLFAGLLGFAIIGLGIFGPMNVFPELKKQGILRRLSTTPITVWQYFLANVCTQVTVGLGTVAIMFAVAITVFNLKVVGNYIELAVFIALSITMILGIGLALGGWARNERQAAPLGNIIVFPMMFLSGTFFPRFVMPEWLQYVSAFLPLTPVIDGIRLIVTEGQHLHQIGLQVGLVLVWMVVIYVIAFRVFRWE